MFKDILQKETAVNFLKGKEFKVILLDFSKKLIFSVVYVLFINLFKLLGFNWLINYLDSFVVPRQNKRVSSLLFLLVELTPSFIAARGFAARVLGFRVQ